MGRSNACLLLLLFLYTWYLVPGGYGKAVFHQYSCRMYGFLCPYIADM